ncbi:hypothetical protein ZWY2020_022054 [Hordeum vulgare]|nr:hypothetical protein ZWY2020_022054 [Hordeum vulgare]
MDRASQGARRRLWRLGRELVQPCYLFTKKEKKQGSVVLSGQRVKRRPPHPPWPGPHRPAIDRFVDRHVAPVPHTSSTTATAQSQHCHTSNTVVRPPTSVVPPLATVPLLLRHSPHLAPLSDGQLPPPPRLPVPPASPAARFLLRAIWYLVLFD